MYLLSHPFGEQQFWDEGNALDAFEMLAWRYNISCQRTFVKEMLDVNGFYEMYPLSIVKMI